MNAFAVRVIVDVPVLLATVNRKYPVELELLVRGQLDEARVELRLDDDLDVGALLHEEEAVGVVDDELVVMVERPVGVPENLVG